ncbi:unnamed protein product [Rotaria magnacalcarata]|uniref:Uncharacterized protein n=1 Tax=Rotaria magnacalcarata TaxID=392030 RepID=A0A820DFZ8_9BILA|nr:unnamed protein product [Rotaria magnacalcarata]CAF4231530.1 unnamed protein product [Rotaria magnacalcarata]
MTTTNNCSCEMYMYICKQHTNPNSLLTNKLKLLNSLARAVSEGRSALEAKLFAELKNLIPVDTESVSKMQVKNIKYATNQPPPNVVNVQIDKRSKVTENKVRHVYNKYGIEVCTYCFHWHHNFFNCRKRLSLCYSCHSPLHKIAQCVENSRNYNKFTPKFVRDVPVERKVPTSPKPHDNSSKRNIPTVPIKQIAPTVPVQQNVTTVTIKQTAPTVPVQQNVTTVTTKPIAPIVTSPPNVLIDSAPPNVPTVASQPNVQMLFSEPNVPTIISLVNVSAMAPLQNKNFMNKTLVKACNNSKSLKTQSKANFEIYNKYTPKFIKDAAVKIYVGNCLRRESVFFSFKRNCYFANDTLNTVISTKENRSCVQYDANSECTEEIKFHDCQNNNQSFLPQNKEFQVPHEMDIWPGERGSEEFERKRLICEIYIIDAAGKDDEFTVKLCNIWNRNDKDSAIPYMFRADALMKLDRIPEAILDYDKVSELSPEDDSAFQKFAIASIYSQLPVHAQNSFLSNFKTPIWNWIGIDENRAFDLVKKIAMEENVYDSEWDSQEETDISSEDASYEEDTE